MRIAIFGCGQLAQMTAQAGLPLGLQFSFIAEPNEDARCVSELGDVVTYDSAMSAEDLFLALNKPDVITVEKEMVPVDLLTSLQQFTQVAPGAQAIFIAQNRIREKNYLRDAGIATADFEVVASLGQLTSLPDRLGYPVYIKAAESGYDGYHQWRIKTAEDLSQPALVAAVNSGVELIAEKHVNYTREFSIIAARNQKGDVVCYPLMENRHEDGVLIATIAPAPNAHYQAEAQQVMQALMHKMQYVGVMTLECFETETGIVANEIAPRVHNSGHWTIEGSATSQFENHCRAIAAMPLGETAVKGVSGLVNMLGKHGDAQLLSSDTLFYHAYGKEERPRRKLGHVTVCASDITTLKQSLNKAMSSLYGERYKPL